MTHESKQVLIIRKDLGMRKGKIAAQAAHASLSALLKLGHWNKDSFTIKKVPKPIKLWMDGSFTKVCVYVESEEELINVFQKSKNKKIPCSLITDAGKTEFGGIPTKTAVAIGPWNATEIDKITGNLKLL